MLNVLRKRLAHDDEQGFTLIELMVVVLIIAILIAIAIPTFLGARQRAQERSAQSNARNALTAAKTIYTDNQDYTEGTAASNAKLAAAAPELTFVNRALTGADAIKVISVATLKTKVQVVVRAESGKCFAFTDDVNSGTTGPTEDTDCNASVS